MAGISSDHDYPIGAFFYSNISKITGKDLGQKNFLESGIS